MWSRKYQLNQCRECRHNNRPHAGHGLCRNCWNRWYRLTHPEQARRDNELTKAWKQANQERVRRTDKEYKDHNRDTIRQYRAKNREGRMEYKRKWRRKHPTKVAAIRMARRARVARVQGHASAEQIDARIMYYGAQCYLCGSDYHTLDHVIPLANGGSAWPANLRPVCSLCNSKKGSMPLSNFRGRKGIEGERNVRQAM